LDEAHRIKNHLLKGSKVISQIDAKYRIAITGTPIHNSIDDFYSLIKFLHYKPFDNFTLWRYIFPKKKNNVEPSAAAKTIAETKDNRMSAWLSCLSDYLLLRRTKKDKIKGTDINLVDLPHKSIEIIRCKLEPTERTIYAEIFGKSKEKFKIFLKNNHESVHTTAGNGHVDNDIIMYLLRLRQACCHMNLISGCHEVEELQAMKNDAAGIDNLMTSLTTNDTASSLTGLDEIDSVNKISDCLKKNHVSSKLKVLLDKVEDIIENEKDDKIIIVSQWTSLSSIIAQHLKSRNIEYCEICKTLGLTKRNKIVEEFNKPSSENVRVMLLSLTSNVAGLIGANRMFIINTHWNPAFEQQAADRIFRVVQKKNVFIYRLICEETIEERILNIQKSKISLADRICGDINETGADSSKLSIKDLKSLFDDDFKSNSQVV
jgi:transcription termination factor 2